MATRPSRKLIQSVQIPPCKRFPLNRIDPDSKAGIAGKEQSVAALTEMHIQLRALQEVLFAQSSQTLLIVLQAMDTGGKDGTIRHVLGPLNPQGVKVTGFGVPSDDELAHDYLWRIHKAMPPKGFIGVFNRSHYESLLVERVHHLAPRQEIRKRYEQINQFEDFLSRNGVTIRKFYLHISKEEQKQRLQARLDRPDKHWKFSANDIKERALWGDYQEAFELALGRCSTSAAPWYAIPANHKWYRNWLIAGILVETLKGMKLKFPPAEPGLDQIVIGD